MRSLGSTKRICRAPLVPELHLQLEVNGNGECVVRNMTCRVASSEPRSVAVTVSLPSRTGRKRVERKRAIGNRGVTSAV